MGELTDRIASLREGLPPVTPITDQQTLADVERLFDEFPDVQVKREPLPLPVYFGQAAHHTRKQTA